MTNTKIYIDGQNLLVRGTYHQIEKVRECLKNMRIEEKPHEVETNNSLQSSQKKKKFQVGKIFIEFS